MTIRKEDASSEKTLPPRSPPPMIIPPTMPKAILAQKIDDGIHDPLPQTLITFQLKLLLYFFITPYKGTPQDRDIVTASDLDLEGKGIAELRCSFLDKVSYLCDAKKRGGTITIAA